MIAGILVAHLVGDYLLQTQWMAAEKVHRWFPAIVHGLAYGLPFLFVTQSPWALFVIVSTHIVLDRYRLARHICWFRNQFAPAKYRPKWNDSKNGSSQLPDWLGTFLMIAVDNTVHILINIAAVYWLG